MKYPLVRDLAVDNIPVTVTCRVLGFSPQAYNKWRRDPVSQRDLDDAHLTNAAIDIHDDDPAFGYRFIYDELAEAGHIVSERRVWRLCSEQGIWSVFSKKRGLNRKAGPPVHDDLVDRDFTAQRIDELWLTTSPSTAPTRASSTAAPSRTSTRIASSATASLIG
jgi:putative transposase